MSESASAPRPAGDRAGREENGATGTEKVLGIVLAIFIAIGAIWGYVKLDEVGKPDYPAYPYLQDSGPTGSAHLAAIREHREATVAVVRARSHRAIAVRSLALHREAYRTALEAGEPATQLQGEYEAARSRLTASSEALATAMAREAATRPAAKAGEEWRRDQVSQAISKADAERAEHDRVVFALRLVLLLAMLGGSYLLLSRMRARAALATCPSPWPGSARRRFSPA